uniref:Uncharacterized protein n=1 Tax=Panagrolaimus sp. ES5 TaxID=591445 RepID=A0AC34F3K3_9BILA
MFTQLKNLVTGSVNLMKNVCELEDGIEADWYPGIQLKGQYDTPEKKLDLLQTCKNQTPEKALKSDYPTIKVISEKTANQRRANFQKSPTNKEIREEFLANVWVHVKMPSEFSYSGAIMLNCARQGLLHSILRHFDDWAKIIPGFQSGINSDIQKQINQIGSAKTPSESRKLLDEFDSVFSGLEDASLIVLHERQMEIFRYLQKNVTYANYLGEGCNDRGSQQVYWKIKDDPILATCVSGQLFFPDSEFQDSRPIRTIVTVFAMPKKDFNDQFIVKLY